MASGELKVGDKIRLLDGEGLQEYGLEAGQEGLANFVVNLPEGAFVSFMPEGGREQYVIKTDRFEVIGEYTGSDLPSLTEEGK